MSNGYLSSGRRMRPIVLAGAAGLLGVASAAQADMKISLQFTNGTSTHQFTAADETTPVEIDVWAQITPNTNFDGPAAPGGGNPNYPGVASDYIFNSAVYGVLSTQVSGSGGGLTSAALEAWANGAGAAAGPITDANGDGAADLGSQTTPTVVNSTL